MNASVVPAGPSAAERVRSVLAAADSLDLVIGDLRGRLVGRHAVDAEGALTVRLPVDSALAAAIGDGVEASVEFTDVAPVALRNRVRAQLTLGGRVCPVGWGTGVARLDPVCVQLIEGARFTLVKVHEVGAAAPDPLARYESSMLLHLASVHGDVVTRLSRLLPMAHLQGVRQIHPVRVDRYGIVLRLERPGGDRDVRLAFASPLGDVSEAAVQMRILLERARLCPRRRRLNTGP
jgi:Domain of unknown function (DUF2470)